MKKEFKKIIAISTTINGHAAYISGHSHRFDDKVVPQFNIDPVHAKEFDSTEEASAYMPTISNPHHRIYITCIMSIPVMHDLKKYDLDKRKEAQRLATPVLRNKIMKDALLTIVLPLLFILCSCTKQTIGQNTYTFTSYKLVRDWYTLDTTFVNRATLWQDDSIWKAETRIIIDSVTDKWYLMCATDKNPLHIEHWYYIRDGKKIWPSKYPLN